MPSGQHDRRPDVLDAARAAGWASDSDSTRHGGISDQFTKAGRTVTCHWVKTPWSDARWAGAVVSGPDGPRQVWKVSGDGGVLAVLKS